MDALAHCLEAYCAPGYHPMAEGIAIEGMRLVKENLARAVADGTDIEARGHMMSAAAMGATAFQKGLGGIHALSHPVGALYNTHHGTTNAVFMPYVLAFNAKAISERMTRLSMWLGLDTHGTAGVIDWVLRLREQVGVPHTLGGLEVDGARIDEIATAAEGDPTAGGNPVKFDRAAARQVFAAALEGKI
jgi:alcohol dehydrogenase